MPGRAAQVHEPREPTQVERGHHLRRAEQAEAAHAHEEFAPGMLIAEEERKDRPIPAVDLLPTMAALAHCMFEMFPQPPGNGVAGIDAAVEPHRAGWAA